MGYVINKQDHGINIAIIGCGGFGREVYHHIKNDIPSANITFYVDDPYAIPNVSLPLSKLNYCNCFVFVAVGDPVSRKNIVERLPADCKFATFIHSSVVILDPASVTVGYGSIICAGTILTTNVKLGNHTHLNLNTTVGHDVVMGDYATTAPAVNISGNCEIGECVYFGTNCAVKEKINICDNVTIGMNAGVVKNISLPGTYVGTPVKLISPK